MKSFMAVYNQHWPNPKYWGEPITAQGVTVVFQARSSRAAALMFAEWMGQLLPSFRGRFDVVETVL